MSLDSDRSGVAIANALMASTGIDAELSEAAKDAFRDKVKLWEAARNDEVVNHLRVDTVVVTAVNGQTGAGPPGGPLPIVAQPGAGTGTADPEGGQGSVS